jgi:phage shock protein PspC (stress-responsive transcriptional regulator)
LRADIGLMNDTSNLPPYGAAPPPPPPPPPPSGPSAGAGPTGPQAAEPQPGQPGGPSDARQRMTRFFDAIRGVGIVRSRHRVVGGVCGGIAERTGIDPTVVRVIAVVLAIFGGIGVLLYGLAWLLLPEPDGRIHGEQVLHGKVDAGAVGAIVVTLLSFGGPSGGWSHWGTGFGWHAGVIGLLWGLTGSAVVIAVIVLAVYLAVRGRGAGTSGPGHPSAPSAPWTPRAPSTPPAPAGPAAPMPPTAPFASGGAAGPTAAYPTGPTNPSSPTYGGTATMTAPVTPSGPTYPAYPTYPTAGPTPSTRRPSLGGFSALVGGLALVGAGISVLVTHSGNYQVNTAAIAWAVALGVIAVALVIGGLLGRRSGVVTLFALIALLGTLAAGAIPKAAYVQAVGERTWTPTTTAHASGGYALGVGHGILDLTDLAPATLGTTDPSTVPVTVGVGQLTIRVPAGMSVIVHTTAGAGSLPRPDVPFVSTTDENLGNGGAFAGHDDNGDLGGAGIKRTVTIGASAPQLIVNAKVGVGEIDIEQVTP